MKANTISLQLLIFTIYQVIIFGGCYFWGSKQFISLEIPALGIHWTFLVFMILYWWIKKERTKTMEYLIAFIAILLIGFGSCAFLIMDNLHG